MKDRTLLVCSLASILVATPVKAQNCTSIFAASSDGWQPVATAPRDGTTIEMLETYGVAPWYGLFKWSDTMTTGGANDTMKDCDNSPSPYDQIDAEYQRSWRHVLDPLLGKDNRLPDDFDARFAKYTREHCHDAPSMTFKVSPEWVSVDENGHSVTEDSCLFWRPYTGDAHHYDDPTHGAQKTVEYECGYLHMDYNKKANRCE